MIRGNLQYQSFTITIRPESIRDLFTTPIVILNNPGEGYFIHLIRVDAFLRPGLSPFATVGPLEITYGNGGSVALEIPGDALSGSMDLSMGVPPETPGPIADYVDSPIFLQASAAVTGSGTGSLVLTGSFALFAQPVSLTVAPVNLFDYSILDYSVFDYSITDQG